MRINEIIPFALNQVQRAQAYLENVITRLFQQIFSNNQPNVTPERLENVVAQIEADPAVQQIAGEVLVENASSESSTQSLVSQESIDNLKSTWKKLIVNGETKSPKACEEVCEKAVNIFGKKRQDENDRFKDLFSLLDEFNFDQAQKKRIYVAITGANEDSPQIAKLVQSATPFKDFAEVYTLLC